MNGKDNVGRKSNAGSSALYYHDKLSLAELRNFLENILEKNNLDQFIVVEDTETENTLAIVREGDMEQFGMYVCGHCGMIFRTREERIVHERIHYFV
ncbi:MAG: C2H2-type zinc finger protein [Candidatus Aminicenantales bacterium]